MARVRWLPLVTFAWGAACTEPDVAADSGSGTSQDATGATGSEGSDAIDATSSEPSSGTTGGSEIGASLSSGSDAEETVAWPGTSVESGGLETVASSEGPDGSTSLAASTGAASSEGSGNTSLASSEDGTTGLESSSDAESSGFGSSQASETGGSGESSGESGTSGEASSSETLEGSSSSEGGEGSPLEDARAQAETIVAGLSLAEKIGQMTLVAVETVGGDDGVAVVSQGCLGGVLGGGNASQVPNDALGWADHHDRWQRAALDSCAGIPLIYGVDAVHGQDKVQGAVIFPHGIGLGATENPALVEEIAEITAREMAATGVRWTFALAVSVARDERWGRTYEGFSEDPEITAVLSEAAVVGLQGEVLGDPYRVAACPKHYLADGATEGGVDRGDAYLDEAQLRAIHLLPFERAIAAGALSVMASFSAWNDLGCTEHRYLLTDVLKGELGFAGFITSDWGAIDALPGNDYVAKVRRSIDAGVDMVMVPTNFRRFINAVTSLVERGDLSIERIDDAVARILTVKIAMGLFESPFARRELLAEVGSAAHRAVARQAVRESAVLLQNDGVLPIPVGAQRIAVVGSKANEIGSQCGGWTLSWQGMAGDITPGTTVLEAVQDRAPEGTVVQYSENGTGVGDADLAVVVIGENPYAEWLGDRASLAFDAVVPAADRQALSNAIASGVPVAVVLISGRPIILTEQLPEWAALLAVWLPGTEGGGIADVLFGDYAPTGRLPHQWPAADADIPLNVGEAGPEPLFEFGFGLGYP